MYTRLTELGILAAQAAYDMSVSDRIQGRYDEYRDAFISNDIHAIMAILMPDFAWKLTDGSTMDRAETQSAIEQQMTDTLSIQEMSIMVDRVSVDGDQATAYVTERLVATMRGADGQVECLVCDETYRDVWVNTPKGWKFMLAEVLTSETSTEPVSQTPRMAA